MGLRNNAFHIMLANGRVAPFYVREPPSSRIHWTIVDHLITIYRLKESDHLEGQTACSINNMATRLCDIYADECERTQYLVLVRDGRGAKKPAVYAKRKSCPIAKHIEFYREHAALIEYAVLHMLYERGFGDRVFFVTGADMSAADRTPAAFVSLYQQCGDASSTVVDNIAAALDGKETRYYNRKPTGVSGVFVYTCADVKTRGYENAKMACLRCEGVEADTVMIELANGLEGSTVVCTRDTDVVAIMTAVGDTDTIVRLNNLSYKVGKNFFLSPFYNALVCGSVREPETVLDFQTESGRMYTLCDVEPHCANIPRDIPALHACWETVAAKTALSPEIAARLLYRNGIRGALYVDLMRLIFGLPDFTDTVALAGRVCAFLQDCLANGVSERMLFHEIRDAVPEDAFVKAILSASYEDRQLRCYAVLCEINPRRLTRITGLYDENAQSPVKRPRIDDEETSDETDASSARPPRAAIIQNNLLSRYRSLHKMYKDESLSRHVYSRYLMLCNAGPFFYLSKKRNLMCDRKKRDIKLMFMILSGTDYTFTLPGLGGTKILTKVIAHREFGRWCLELVDAWSRGYASPTAVHEHAVKLAQIAGFSSDRATRTWTPDVTNKCIRSMEYAYKLWTGQRPAYGPDYYPDE